MLSNRFLMPATIGLALLLAAGGAAAEDASDASQGAAIQAKPAVLVLRVWDHGQRQRAPRVDVLEPPGMNWPLRTADEAEPHVVVFDEGAPQLGNGFELVKRWKPGVRARGLEYFIYQIDLDNPSVAKHWRELSKAQFAERRRQQALLKGERKWKQRKRRLLDANRQAVYDGIALLRAESYRHALIKLALAAELNHGDPISRLHLAQARMALGHDAEAGRLLRRALELQPKLVPMKLNLDEYYSSPLEFHAQIDALTQRLEEKKDASHDEHFLLGFMEFQRDRWEAAHEQFRRAAETLKDDDRLKKFLSLTRPAEQ